jgi:hypothetical protein
MKGSFLAALVLVAVATWLWFRRDREAPSQYSSGDAQMAIDGEKFLDVGAIETVKLADGNGLSGPMMGFSVSVANRSPRRLSMVMLTYTGPPDWSFHKPGDSESSSKTITLLYTRDEMPNRKSPVCDPGATLRVGDAYELEHSSDMEPNPIANRPDFPPSSMRLEKRLVAFHP